jgi:hypothetical protein
MFSLARSHAVPRGGATFRQTRLRDGSPAVIGPSDGDFTISATFLIAEPESKAFSFRIMGDRREHRWAPRRLPDAGSTEISNCVDQFKNLPIREWSPLHGGKALASEASKSVHGFAEGAAIREGNRWQDTFVCDPPELDSDVFRHGRQPTEGFRFSIARQSLWAFGTDQYESPCVGQRRTFD